MDNEMNKFRDIGENVFKYKNLKSTVDGELTYPERYKAKREEYTRLLIGPTDGKVCERMMDILEKN